MSRRTRIDAAASLAVCERCGTEHRGDLAALIRFSREHRCEAGPIQLDLSSRNAGTHGR